MISDLRKACAVLALAACLSASLGACMAMQSEAHPRAEEPVAFFGQVEVDGARLYFEVRGDRADAPLLLWLHGGPGGAERPLFRYFNGDLERRFLVAYYDQRGAGRSFDPEASADSLTIAQHLLDLNRLVDHLRLQYNRDRVLLVGHSWGAVLGTLYAKAYPQKVLGLICVAPVVSFAEQQRREFDYDWAEATRRADQRALAELREIGPPPYSGSSAVIRLQRVTERYRGVSYKTHSRAIITLEGILRGLVTPWEIVRIVQGMHRSLEAMHQELLAFDLRQEVAALDVPVSFFLGRHDRHVDSNLAAEYLEALSAPSKGIVWFEEAAHDIPFDQPAAFNSKVIETLAYIKATEPSAFRPLSRAESAGGTVGHKHPLIP